MLYKQAANPKRSSKILKSTKSMG